MSGSSLRSRFSESDSSSETSSVAAISESASARADVVMGDADDKLFVAVGEKVSESKSTLLWALQQRKSSSGGDTNRRNSICLLHVHQPSETINVLGGKFPVSSLGEREVKAHRDNERQKMNKILDEYVRICTKAGAQAEKLYIDMDSIEKGIIELITRHRIGKLVMGGAADARYSRKMIEPKSKKASYVRQHAPAFCHIWFICKQRLIHTREGKKESGPNDEGTQSSHSRSDSVATLESHLSKPDIFRGVDPHRESRYMDSEADGVVMLSPSASIVSMFSIPESMLDAGSSIDFDQSSMRSVSQSSVVSTPSGLVVGSPFSSLSRIREREDGFSFSSLPHNGERFSRPSPPNVLEIGVHDKLYQQLVQAMEEAEISRRQAYLELMRRQKAEKDTIQALRRAKASETLYMEEMSRRKEVEEELAKRTEELENIKNQRDLVLEELEVTRDEKLLLETRVETSDHFVSELGEKIVSVVELLQNYK